MFASPIHFAFWGLIDMKKTLLAALLAGTALAAPAAAADLPRAYPAPVVAVPVAYYNWTGFYVGGFVGGAFGGDVRATEVGAPNVWNAVGQTTTYDLENKFIFGGQLGYNWQASGSPFVWGLELEIGSLNRRGNGVLNPPPGLNDTISFTEGSQWYALLAARAGYAVDRTLFYVKGGIAYTDKPIGSIIDVVGATVAGDGEGKEWTWALGAGIEYAFAPNWTVKGEYLYFHTRKTIGIDAYDPGLNQYNFTQRLPGTHTLKLGVNYRF